MPLTSVETLHREVGTGKDASKVDCGHTAEDENRLQAGLVQSSVSHRHLAEAPPQSSAQRVRYAPCATILFVEPRTPLGTLGRMGHAARHLRSIEYPTVSLRNCVTDGKIAGMRVNLITESSGPYCHGTGTIPLLTMIRPAYGLPGEYVYSTDSAALLRLLRRATDLPSTVLKRFEGDLYTSSKAKLLSVKLDDKALTDIGYFID